MKKLIILCSCLLLIGCGNYDLLDTEFKYTKAIVRMPDGEVVELEIDKWRDYDGEQIQIQTTDGKVYVVSSYNCVLVNE